MKFLVYKVHACTSLSALLKATPNKTLVFDPPPFISEEAARFKTCIIALKSVSLQKTVLLWAKQIRVFFIALTLI